MEADLGICENISLTKKDQNKWINKHRRTCLKNEREWWWIKKTASFRIFGKPWMSKGPTIVANSQKVFGAQGSNHHSGSWWRISQQWGFSCLPTQPVGRGDLLWGWCRRMLPSSIKSNNLFLGAGCGYFHVWCSLSDELFLNVQNRTPSLWTMAMTPCCSPFTSKKSLAASTAAHVVTENYLSPSSSPALFHLLLGCFLQASTQSLTKVFTSLLNWECI